MADATIGATVTPRFCLSMLASHPPFPNIDPKEDLIKVDTRKEPINQSMHACTLTL